MSLCSVKLERRITKVEVALDLAGNTIGWCRKECCYTGDYKEGKVDIWRSQLGVTSEDSISHMHARLS